MSCNDQIHKLLGFEPWTSHVSSDQSANCATAFPKRFKT